MMKSVIDLKYIKSMFLTLSSCHSCVLRGHTLRTKVEVFDEKNAFLVNNTRRRRRQRPSTFNDDDEGDDDAFDDDEQ